MVESYGKGEEMMRWLKDKIIPSKSTNAKSTNKDSARSDKSGAHEKKIILFDLDGTLLDSVDGIYESFSRACEDEYFPSIQEVRGLIGLPLEDMFRRIGFDDDELQRRVERYKNHYRRICVDKTKLLPQAKEAVVLAHSFAHLGIITSRALLYSKQILKNLRMLKYFQVIIGREDVSAPKPHAEPILRALDFFPITPKEKVYMIGDTIYDLQAAKNAGVNGIWVRNGFGENLDEIAPLSFDNAYRAVEYIQNLA